MSQHPHVFRRSLRDNLLIARPDADDDTLLAALARAGLREHVDSLAGGLDASLAEHGGTWSGGQRQRLGLARGLLVDPAVLILDEPTANLDGGTEQRFLSELARVRAGRTTLVASHRVSTLQRFPHVLLLVDGRIVAAGSHESLLAGEERYRAVLGTGNEQG